MKKLCLIVYCLLVSCQGVSNQDKADQSQLTSEKNDATISAELSQEPGSWSDIDFWELSISESPCSESDEETSPLLCEVQNLDPELTEKYIGTLDQNAPNGEYIIDFSDGILTITSLAEPKNSFVCCDIQGPFRPAVSHDGRTFSFARYQVPADGIFKIGLLNDVKSIGPKLISVSPDEYQKTYIDVINSDLEPLNSETLSLDNVDRDIYLFRSHPSRPPKSIFYFMDGDGMLTYIYAIRSHFKDQQFSFAAIGIPSGDSDDRTNEYVKTSTEDVQAYEDHQRQFLEQVVPQLEAILGGGFTKKDRILVGASAGGIWVTNFYLENPEFACSLIAFSIAGSVPDVKASRLSDTLNVKNDEDCNKSYFSYGEYEGEMFVKDTIEIARRFKAIGVDVKLFSENSGHSYTSWVPSFLRSFEHIKKSEN